MKMWYLHVTLLLSTGKSRTNKGFQPALLVFLGNLCFCFFKSPQKPCKQESNKEMLSLKKPNKNTFLEDSFGLENP